MKLLTPKRTDDYKPWLLGLCVFSLGWITMLLYAGGFTTTIRAGMAFLDWPLSNGSLNPENWTRQTDMLAEHSHRLLGKIIGILSLVLLYCFWLTESRLWMRMLSRVLALVVILQGLLGGSRVVFDRLNIQTDSNLIAQSFAVIHACGAMIVLGILVALTLGSSRAWIERNSGLAQSVPGAVRNWGIVSTAVIFLQILIGAVMRHAEAGLAIAKFPLAQPGSLLPAYWNFDVGIHFAHRAGAVVVTLALLIYLSKLWASKNTRRAFVAGILVVLGLLLVQIWLGAQTIWTTRNIHVATVHHLVGAFLLASTWALTFLTYRPEFSESTDNTVSVKLVQPSLSSV